MKVAHFVYFIEFYWHIPVAMDKEGGGAVVMTFKMTVERVKIAKKRLFFTFKNSCHTVGSICIAGGVLFSAETIYSSVQKLLPSLIDDKYINPLK